MRCSVSASLRTSARSHGTRYACGALRYREAAEQELGRLGHRVHRRARPGRTNAIGIESLTERKLQIARLVERKTNPQIAAELYLSQKPLRRTCGISGTRSVSRHASAWRLTSSAPTERRARHLAHATAAARIPIVSCDSITATRWLRFDTSGYPRSRSAAPLRHQAVRGTRPDARRSPTVQGC